MIIKIYSNEERNIGAELNQELKAAIRSGYGVARLEWLIEKGAKLSQGEWNEEFKVASRSGCSVARLEWLIEKGASLSQEEWDKSIDAAKRSGRSSSKLEQFRDKQLVGEYEILPLVEEKEYEEEDDSDFTVVQRSPRR